MYSESELCNLHKRCLWNLYIFILNHNGRGTGLCRNLVKSCCLLLFPFVIEPKETIAPRTAFDDFFVVELNVLFKCSLYPNIVITTQRE